MKLLYCILFFSLSQLSFTQDNLRLLLEPKTVKEKEKKPVVKKSKKPVRKTFFPLEISPEVIKIQAKAIDDILEKFQKDKGKRASGIVNDSIFVRRVYLDIVGRIPLYDECVDFIKSKDPQKRAKLIDKLLMSDGYAHHYFNFWANILKLRSNNDPAGIYYQHWLKQTLKNNKPYNQMVYELITASGFPWQNGAVGYSLQSKSNVELTLKTLKIFVATDMYAVYNSESFDKQWTQKDFYQTQAWFNGVQRGNGRLLSYRFYDKSVTALDQFYQTILLEVDKTGQIKVPDFNKSPDLQTYKLYNAKVPFGDPYKIITSPRNSFANWLISPFNSNFNTVIVNRLWEKLMGCALIYPVEKITPRSYPSNDKLLLYLKNMMRRNKYNMKEFIRIIMNTKAYQRETRTKPFPKKWRDFTYNDYILKPLSAEQLWDSLMIHIIEDLDSRKGHGSLYTSDTFVKILNELNVMDQDQFLAYKNGEQYKAMIRELNSNSIYKSWQKNYLLKPSWKNLPQNFVRASELQSPALGSDQLRLLGQSDKSSFQKAQNKSIAKVLALLNGSHLSFLESPDSALSKVLLRSNDMYGHINILYFSFLSRQPSVDELQALVAIQNAHKKEWKRIILRAILNTREFIYKQ